MAVDDTENAENAPLLRPKRPTHSRAQSVLSIIPTAHNPTTITILLIVMTFVIASGGALAAVPGMRILEDILCHHYYDRIKGEGHVGLFEDIDERMCKRNEIQEELAFIRGILQLLSAIPGEWQLSSSRRILGELYD